MKRGLLLIILLFFLTVANAQKDDLRLTIDSKFLEKQGIIINLTDFLDVKPEYYLANRPKYVSIILDNEFKLAKIQPIEGKSGRETVVITTNKSKEFSTSDLIMIEEKVENEFENIIKQSFELKQDPILSKTLLESIKHLNLTKKEIKPTQINLIGDNLKINIDNQIDLDLKVSKIGETLFLNEISFKFDSSAEDYETLFYTSEKPAFFYLLKRNIMFILIAFLSIILLTFISIIIHRLTKKDMTKDDFKKIYINKMTTLKRICHEYNLDDIFTQFSIDMRAFLAKILNIKYQFTYDELINELIIKKINEDVKKDLIKFANVMLEKRYIKKASVHDVKDLIGKGISIIKRF